jgi:hypothetical protein
MVFAEKKNGEHYEYQCTDLFGEITFCSPTKIEKHEYLDAIVMKILELATEKGELLLDNFKISYGYKQANNWQEDEGADNGDTLKSL